jgi:soluble lytic murein transglycosylase
MELIDYEESKKYGKKVLTNYVIYMNILGEKIKITPLLNVLDDPKKTDRYRKK